LIVPSKEHYPGCHVIKNKLRHTSNLELKRRCWKILVVMACCMHLPEPTPSTFFQVMQAIFPVQVNLAHTKNVKLIVRYE
jgi:hypothetical protein